jgi:hypothetical protein
MLMERAVDFGLNLFVCFLTQCFCATASGITRSPISYHCAYLLNLIIMFFEIALVYLIRVYFGSEGIRENEFMQKWVCSMGVCEIIFVYKIVAAIITYHLCIILTVHICGLNRSGFALAVYDSYWGMKTGFKAILVGFYVFFVPEYFFVKLSWIIFLYAGIFVLVTCFATVIFAYGTVKFSVHITRKGTLSFDIDQQTRAEHTNDDEVDDVNDCDNEEDGPVNNESVTIVETEQQVSVTEIIQEKETRRFNYFFSFFAILSVMLFVYILTIIYWIVTMFENYSNCHINTIVLISYALCLFLGMIVSALPSVQERQPDVNGFVFLVVGGICSYFLWNVAVMDDPLNCTQTVYIGEGLHVFTIISFLVFFSVYCIFISIQQERKPSAMLSSCEIFHYMLSGCFCYICVLITDWSIPIVFEDTILQETVVSVPLFFHSFAIVLLVSLFIYSLIYPICCNVSNIQNKQEIDV